MAKTTRCRASTTVLTNAYRKIDDRSYEIVIKMDGAFVATARVAVSPGRANAQRLARKVKPRDGQIMRTTTVDYERTNRPSGYHVGRTQRNVLLRRRNVSNSTSRSLRPYLVPIHLAVENQTIRRRTIES